MRLRAVATGPRAPRLSKCGASARWWMLYALSPSNMARGVMEQLHLLLYLQEIQAQCRMARIAFDSLSRWPPTHPPAQTIEDGAVKTAAFFRDMHSMLTHVGVISKLLWPIKEKRANTREQRGAELRARLGLPAADHILCARTLRDDLEHFDERLDRWVLRQDGKRPPDYWQDCIGPWEVPLRHGAEAHNVMRHYDPGTKLFRFQGKSMHMPELVLAVKALQDRVDGEVAQLLAQLYPTPDHVATPDFSNVMPW